MAQETRGHPEGEALLDRVRRARSAEYAAGVSGLSAKVRADLLAVLRRALKELPHEVEAVMESSSAHS